MKTLKDIKETFSKGNILCKLEMDQQEPDTLTYWFDIKNLMITHTKWGYNSNRSPLFYDNEIQFYAAISRMLRKQK
tara:strand:+ start:161 stop:388 length:228 start_codon:yes stop_codon:yes gene_type:complete